MLAFPLAQRPEWTGDGGALMSQMPADAPRSEDGQWWWDGTQWQPVTQDAGAGAGTGNANAGQGGADQTTSGTVGQLSMTVSGDGTVASGSRSPRTQPWTAASRSPLC